MRLMPTIDETVDLILATLPPRIVLGLPLGIGKPNPLVNALYRRIKADPSRQLEIFTEKISVPGPFFHALKCLASLFVLNFTVACQPTALDKAKAGQALWEEKCKTVAGEKIYKTVPDVEGVVLLKVRPQAGDREWADPMWPGAAFAREARTTEYITTFLGYEYATTLKGNPEKITLNNRGYIATDRRPNLMEFPGYRYVDVIDEKDGQRYRYSGRWEEPWQKDKSWLKGYIKFYLDKTPVHDPAPRYGVTYEDHVIAEERALGVSSSTVKVLDLKTNEVLGEMIRYAWSTPVSSANPSPWLAAHICPGHAVGAGAATRKFVDQILIPKKGN